jgi:hypothetical protein
MLDRPRAATVTATGPLKCVKLDRARYLIPASGVPGDPDPYHPYVFCSVVDPHHFDAHPDSTYHPDADADPDSGLYLIRIRILICI